MPKAWRLVREKHEATAFSGEEAAKYAGRWNSRGVPVVYTSSALSLAALELLVHLIPPVTFRYLAFPLEFDDSLVETLPPARLLSDWRLEPPSPMTQAIGSDWVGQARTAVLRVPSVIIPQESNYLLNPAHPDFAETRIGKPEPFAFDPWLLT